MNGLIECPYIITHGTEGKSRTHQQSVLETNLTPCASVYGTWDIAGLEWDRDISDPGLSVYENNHPAFLIVTPVMVLIKWFTQPPSASLPPPLTLGGKL